MSIKDKDGITVKSLTAVNAEDRLALKQKMEDTVMASSCEEYPTCLFLLVADDRRYKLLNTELEKNFLLGKQEYPMTIMAAKRLITGFQPTGGSVGGTHNKEDRPEPTNVSLVQTKWTTGGFKPICKCCGKLCNTGRWRKCPNVTQQKFDRTTKLVEERHFE